MHWYHGVAIVALALWAVTIIHISEGESEDNPEESVTIVWLWLTFATTAAWTVSGIGWL